MKDYTTATPAFSDTIMEPETTDLAHPDSFNPAYEQLLQNTLANRQLVAGLFGFSYEESSEAVINWLGASYQDDESEAIWISESAAKMDEELEIVTLAVGTSITPYFPEGGGEYVLPTATVSRLGGVKIGENVNVESDGTISVDADESTAEAAAEIVEKNATEPSNSDIDNLFN